ncbi:MAG: hypothetical protein AAF489_02755 [Bacteroidota bacterium]
MELDFHENSMEENNLIGCISYNYMHRKLIKAAFQKASKDIGSKTPHRIAEYISNTIQENSRETYGVRSLTDNHKLAIEGSEKNIEFRQGVVQALCEFLGHKDFQEFQRKNHEQKLPLGKKVMFVIKKKRAIVVIILIAFLTVTVITYVNKERWMEWKQDHYKEVSFDSEKLTNGTLKLYNKDRINRFRQVFPDCSYPFFKENGSENLWYGKNKDGVYEYFTDLGLHPNTGRTLKKITEYMVETHICKSN